MFEGYLIKIDDNILPNKYINIKTYAATHNRPIILSSFKDGNGVRRKQLSHHKTTLIEFQTNGMYLQDRKEFLNYFPNKTQLNITYWNDEKGIYEQGIFESNEWRFEMYKLRGNNIIYKPLAIVLEEY